MKKLSSLASKQSDEPSSTTDSQEDLSKLSLPSNLRSEYIERKLRDSDVPDVVINGYRPLSMVREDDGDYLLTLEHVKSGKTHQLIGSSTVWYSFPEFKRQGTSIEYWVTDIYEAVSHYREVGGKLPEVRTSKKSKNDDRYMGKYRFVSMEPSGNRELLTIERLPNKRGVRAGRAPQLFQFLGGSTVWHTYPGYRRASGMERMLSEFYEYACYMRKKEGR